MWKDLTKTIINNIQKPIALNIIGKNTLKSLRMPVETKHSDMLQWVVETVQSLQSYCLKRNFTGADPYDGLESRLFKRIPIIRSSRICRLAWIQLFKRLPLNLRYVTKVPLLANAKTYALFLKSYCLQYKINGNADSLDKIHFFIRELKHMVCKGYHGACWGYPFDWQSRSFFSGQTLPPPFAQLLLQMPC